MFEILKGKGFGSPAAHRIAVNLTDSITENITMTEERPSVMKDMIVNDLNDVITVLQLVKTKFDDN